MTRYALSMGLMGLMGLAVGCSADAGDDGRTSAGSDGATSQGQPGDGMSSGEDDGSSDTSGTSDTSDDTTTTGGPEPTGGNGVVCALAETEPECATAVSGSDEGCVWFPHYTVTTNDGTACDFEPAGGSCSAPFMGDTDCGTHVAACDVEIHALPGDADGVFTIARNDDGCAYAPNLPRVDCDNLMTGAEPGFEDFACGCGCDPSYPE